MTSPAPQLPLSPELAPAPKDSVKPTACNPAIAALHALAGTPELTRRQLREQLHELHQRAIYAPPRAVPNLEPAGAPLIDLAAVRRERAAAGQFGTAAARSALTGHSGSTLAPADLIGRLMGAYAQNACNPADRRPEGLLASAGKGLSVTTRVEFPPSANSLDIRQLRARVRNAVRRLHAPRSNLAKCGERRYRKDGGVVAMVRGADDGKARGGVTGLVRCGSVHSCPKCAPRICAGRAEQVTAIVTAHRDRTRTAEAPEGAAYLLTLTVPHDVTMRCKRLRRHVSDAWKLVQQGAPWRRLKRRMGFVGSITSREITHGGNGWHPHLHVLLCLDRVLTAEQLDALTDALYRRWVDAVERVPGLRLHTPTREHGISLTPSYRDDYIQKLGLADELTRALKKHGRGSNRTPFEIMADWERHHAPRDGGILKEYFRGIKGARQLTWSRGAEGAEDLRRVYRQALETAAPEQTDLRDFGFESDAELIRREDEQGTAVATLPGRQWDALVRVMRRARGDAEYELVTAAEQAGAIGVEAMLAAAYRLGRELAAKDPRLRRWLWWLTTPDDGDRPEWTLTTAERNRKVSCV